jgi:hypothetical protein
MLTHKSDFSNRCAALYYFKKQDLILKIFDLILFKIIFYFSVDAFFFRTKEPRGTKSSSKKIIYLELRKE